MLATRFTALAGIDVPLVQAPIAASPALAAAVSEAGALGHLSCSYAAPAEVAAFVADALARTARPVAVNVVLEWDQRERLEAALRAGARIVTTTWGDPEPLVARLREAGALWLHVAGSTEEAERGLELGCHALCAQGWEAGGHVRSDVSTLVLVPRLVDLAAAAAGPGREPVPVVAAGGVADGRGLAAVLCLGAGAAWLGTRFIACAEAPMHPRFVERLLAADSEDAARPGPFLDGWDGEHRALRTPLLRAWEDAGRPAPGARPGEGEQVATAADGRPILRYHFASPRVGVEGRIEEMALYAGQTAGLVHAVRTAAEIVREVAGEAEAVLARLAAGAGAGA